MWLALATGAIAGSSVFLGALTGIFVRLREMYIAVIMAFGAGILLGASVFELLTESVEMGGLIFTSTGFLLGSLIFTGFNLYLAKKGGHKRKSSDVKPSGHSGKAILFGTILDAIPESVIIGVAILQNGTIGWLLVIAVFISNFPEGLSSSVGLKKNGYSNKKILVMWGVVCILAGLSSLAGYFFFEDTSPQTIAMISSFAAGGIIAMVTDTMVPESFRKGGPLVGFVTSLGLLTSLILTHFQ
ncbi:ZIP family metal transporter [Pseudalkalibacillus decolorationis]|uniref:ZIP family metal transporter n=1 Tax=Pseudalkalibacillus decolorationis TaxID=163879 RepID=UPI002147EA30|nr:ZIP family metal transporter [Pseudalkalibacillus decolorationis]